MKIRPKDKPDLRLGSRLWLNDKKFYVVHPQFRSGLKKGKLDYYQLIDTCLDTFPDAPPIYMLKVSPQVNGINQLKLHHLGYQIAQLLDIPTQKCEVVTKFDCFALLIKDIRCDKNYSKMEPLCFYVKPRFFKKEKIIHFNSNAVIIDPLEIARFVKEGSVQWALPYSTTLLFDRLIGNCMRSTRSIRFLLDHETGSLTHHLLIETPFGSQYTLERVPFPYPHLQKIGEAIINMDEVSKAIHFGQKICDNYPQILDLIKNAEYLGPDEKDQCLEILNLGFEEINQVLADLSSPIKQLPGEHLVK